MRGKMTLQPGDVNSVTYLPAFYEAKKAGKKAVFSKSEPDKLFVDDKLIV